MIAGVADESVNEPIIQPVGQSACQSVSELVI